ncbi:MAG: hypothetical protein M1838_001270 [Thelocarpon superellum]|nr:MAG: hypothetical protein M1838_001270 [Thelocarpon superellum]
MNNIVLDAPTLTHNHVRTPVPVAAPVPTLAPAPQLHIPTHRRLESESTIRAATPPPRRSKRFSFETSPERRRVSTLTMVDTLADSFRWMDDSPDLNLRFSLDERPRADVPKKAPAAFTTLSPKPTRRASIRRPVRIGSKSSRSSRRRTPSITGPARPTPRHRQTMHEEAPARSSIGFELPRRRSEGPSAVADPEATYYQDPNAREKVRQFLTSPRRFDEAIEFGFPSLAEGNKENLRPETISAKAIKSPQYTEGRTFFDDETASLSENGDESSVPDSDVPRTPSDLETTFQSPHRLPSSKSSSSGSVTPQRPTIRYPSGKNIVAALGENREMTLRMTLTKPELRADEDALYGWQGRGKDDPLALDGMTPFVEASHGAPGPFGGVDGWGPPPKENGIVRKLLRRMTVTSRRVPSA